MPKTWHDVSYDPAVVERLEMEECPWMWFDDELMCPHCGGRAGECGRGSRDEVC